MYLLVAFSSSGVCIIQNAWNLDGSWWWLTSNASATGQIGSKGMIGTYGPFGFLDFQLPTWKLGLFLSVIWHLFGGLISFAVFLKVQERTKRPILLRYGTSYVTSVIVSFYLPPSTSIAAASMLYFSYIFMYERNKSRNLLLAGPLGALCALEFQIKVLPGVLLVCSVLILFLNLYQNQKSILAKFMGYFLISFLVTLILTFLLFGFTKTSVFWYMKGTLEITLGYKNMAYEEPGRYWEYLVAFVFIGYVFRHLWLASKDKVLILINGLYFFALVEYSFIRHDSHVDLLFVILFCYIFLYLNFNSLTAMGSVLALVAVSGLNLNSLLDLGSRTSQSIEVIKSADPRYWNTLSQNFENFLKNQYPLNSKLLRTIGIEKVAILPWDQLAGYAYNLNLDNPPVPQPITAYTPWLDRQNALWISKKSSAPKYILMSQPKSIDYRNPWWDSPRMQLDLICNYKTSEYEGNWILFERRTKSVCLKPILLSTTQQKRLQIPDNSQSIVIANISHSDSLVNHLLRLLFKPISNDKIYVDGVPTRILWNNAQSLVFSVPSQENFPSLWKIPTIHTLASQNLKQIQFFKVPISFNQ